MAANIFSQKTAGMGLVARATPPNQRVWSAVAVSSITSVPTPMLPGTVWCAGVTSTSPNLGQVSHQLVNLLFQLIHAL